VRLAPTRRRDCRGCPGQLDCELKNPEAGGCGHRRAGWHDRREDGRDCDVAAAESGREDERDRADDAPDRDRGDDHRKIRQVDRVEGEHEQVERDPAENRGTRVQGQEAPHLHGSEHARQRLPPQAREKPVGDASEHGRMQGQEDQGKHGQHHVSSGLGPDARPRQHEPCGHDGGRRK
jgi:hypothetical protein